MLFASYTATMFSYCACFIAPNLPKLARYLEKLNDWEDFGIFLLPEDDAEHLTQVKMMTVYVCFVSLFSM